MISAQIDLSKYIGLEYGKAGRGPETYDCWGLVRIFYGNELGIELPEYPGVKHDAKEALSDAIAGEKESGNWEHVESPELFDLVLMRDAIGGWHVGIYVLENGPRVLHICSGQTSCLESMGGLQRKGIKSLEYYRWSQQST